MPVVPTKRLADASSKKPAKKKKTKKQLTKEASARRREMAAFDKVWGHQNSSESVELQGDIEEPNQLLRSSGGNTPLRFDYVDTLDSNIANAAGQTELITDGEGDEDTAEADADADSESDASDAEICKSDMLQHEIRRVAELMNNAERDRLHLRIQGKPPYR
ncbi:hypothetical protein PInf_020544 [Phytophthora infestans]|nr:hypothetical protein PInf_020544 [Phytophthora infestans]